MIACYDLSRCPPTYDVVAFLALLELERKRIDADDIELHILPGPAGGFRQDLLWPHSIEERVALREKVLHPICTMLPSVRSVEVRSNRSVDGWGKDARFISLPAIVDALRRGSRPLRAPSVVSMHAGPYVTFTLREASHHPKRNSRTADWVRAALEIEDRTGTRVVVIRDTLCAREPLEQVTTYPEASLDVMRRAALYAGAKLNVGISNGPMWLAVFLDAPVLMLRPTTNAAHGCYDDAFYARCGLPHGSSFPQNPPHQTLAWYDDTYDHIVRTVDEKLTEMSWFVRS